MRAVGTYALLFSLISVLLFVDFYHQIPSWRWTYPLISSKNESICLFPLGFGILGGGEGSLRSCYYSAPSNGTRGECTRFPVIAAGPVGGPLEGPAGGLNGLPP
jgi:hypothetical protein